MKTHDIREQLQTTLGVAYTLERELGGGGMSRVFVAEEIALRRKVAVKVLPPELTAGVNVERFNREILVAAKLQHPHIVPVLAAGETNGLPYYTMPFVEGESLRARLGRSGALSITEAVSVLKDVARALAYAHERGIVHRDIKPDNVLLTGGSATVTDFGIAKAISVSRTQGSGETLTQIGTSIGTPAYMSPEQAAGDPETDHRTDIYSLGCMAYELLAGQPPFNDTSPRKLLAAHMGETPRPLVEFRRDTPASLSDLVMRCIAKEAGDRPAQAGDVVRVLETVTSADNTQALPAILFGGPGMLRKALAIYAVAFAVVAIVAKAAIVGIGLPDWVFSGALIVMALGLPVVLWTGYVYRVARRVATATPTFTPGGTPSTTAHGTIATIALKAAPHVSWYRTARGGLYALGAFVLMIAAFMTARAIGIGPFGSLIATGALAESNTVVMADFTASNGDSALGRVVSEAVRAGLADSRVFSVLATSDVAAALRRMERDPRVMLHVDLAREVAVREGAKAVVDGSVTPVGTSYIVTARLVTSDSARELVSYRATASHADAIIDVADELSRKLRARAGESLRRVQATPRLHFVTTSSLAALRLYTEGSRANDVDRNQDLAVARLREAVRIDTTFAEGWRKLAVAMRNQGSYRPSAIDSALERALAHSQRLSETERDRVAGSYYYRSDAHGDRGKAIAALQRVLARGDSSLDVSNLASALASRREYAAAEELYRAQARIFPEALTLYTLLVSVLDRQGKLTDADSVVEEAQRRFAGNTSIGFLGRYRDRVRGRVDSWQAALDSAYRAGNARAPAAAAAGLRFASAVTGRVRDALTFSWEEWAIDSARGTPRPRGMVVGGDLTLRAWAGLPTDSAVREFESAFVRDSISEFAPIDRARAYLAIASTFAHAGYVDNARAVIGRYDREVRDTAIRRTTLPWYQRALGQIAARDRRWTEAIALTRRSFRLPDGPSVGEEVEAVALIELFGHAGMADSAIAEYERYLATPFGGRRREGPDLEIPAPVALALAKMYDSKGNSQRAAALYTDFIELWKNADPELQPRVEAARERLRVIGSLDPPRQERR